MRGQQKRLRVTQTPLLHGILNCKLTGVDVSATLWLRLGKGLLRGISAVVGDVALQNLLAPRPAVSPAFFLEREL